MSIEEVNDTEDGQSVAAYAAPVNWTLNKLVELRRSLFEVWVNHRPQSNWQQLRGLALTLEWRVCGTGLQHAARLEVRLKSV